MRGLHPAKGGDLAQKECNWWREVILDLIESVNPLKGPSFLGSVAEIRGNVMDFDEFVEMWAQLFGP